MNNREFVRSYRRVRAMHIYLVMGAVDGERALLRDADGYVLAWNDWDAACDAAGRVGSFVTNWDFILRHSETIAHFSLEQFARVCVKTFRGDRRFLVSFSATPEEINSMDSIESERKKTPRIREEKCQPSTS